LTWWLFCSTRVANELGAGNPRTAKGVVRVVVILGIVEAIIMSIVFFSCRHVLGYAYSNDIEVVDYLASMAPILCVSLSADSLNGALSGDFKIIIIFFFFFFYVTTNTHTHTHIHIYLYTL